MRLANKTNNIATSTNGFIHSYYLVPDNYDFIGNNAIDVTSPISLETFFENGGIEYGVFRASLTNLFIPIWNSLSFDEKKVCVKHYKYPLEITQDEFNSYFSTADHENNWNSVTFKTREMVRMKRLFAAFSKISYALSSAQVAAIYLTVKPLCFDYYYANIPNLMCWISNSVSPLGNDYTSAGFAQMSGYTTTLRDELLDILNNGNYIYF
jgi:hypothetical protein